MTAKGIVIGTLEWQPIATAPKGEWILVVDQHEVGVWQACWSKKLNCFVWADGLKQLRNAKSWTPLPSTEGQPK